jgi:hypothetical protein
MAGAASVNASLDAAIARSANGVLCVCVCVCVSRQRNCQTAPARRLVLALQVPFA